MKKLIWFVLLFVGCSESATELTAWQKSMRDGSVEAVEVAKQVEKKQDASIVILRDQTAALARIETKLEASLSSPKSNGTEVIQSTAPESPAKANDTPNPLKVATPGTSQESLVELASRLYAQGVNVNNRTREELEAIDSQIVDTKSTHVQYRSRPTYSQPAGTVCVNGRCFVPQVSSRRRR